MGEEKINFLWCFVKKTQFCHGLIDPYFGSSAAINIQFYKEKNPIFFIAKVVMHFRYECLSFTSFMWDYVIVAVF